MKSLRIALIHVGHRRLFKHVSPPLGLLYLAGYVRSKRNTVIQVFDQRAENAQTDDIVRRVAAFEPDVVGLSCLSAYGYMLRDMVGQIREAIPRCLIVLGGPHPSVFGARMLEEMPADAVVIGEGELAFEQVLRAFSEDTNLAGVPGLVWREPSGEIVQNPGTQPLIEDLDALPFPAYDLVDLPRYGSLWGLSIVPPPRKYIPMFTSRGCPYHCFYCHSMLGKHFRAHSPERVVEEMKYYAKTYDLNNFEFVDDVFNLDRGRVLRISELYLASSLRHRVGFGNGLRADILTEEVLDALKAMGAYTISLALETGSPRLQKVIGKNLNIERYLKATEMAARRGILTSGFAMLGFPTETEADMQQTVEVACASALHLLFMLKVTPYPNTDLYALAMKTHPDKLAAIDFSDTDFSYRAAINLSEVPDAVVQAYIRKTTKRFYLNPRRIGRILRDFPDRHRLPYYAADLVRNLTNRTLLPTSTTTKKM